MPADELNKKHPVEDLIWMLTTGDGVDDENRKLAIVQYFQEKEHRRKLKKDKKLTDKLTRKHFNKEYRKQLQNPYYEITELTPEELQTLKQKSIENFERKQESKRVQREFRRDIKMHEKHDVIKMHEKHAVIKKREAGWCVIS